MAKHEKIMVLFRDESANRGSFWEWALFAQGVVCESPGYHSKAAALRSARAFARKFINPPEVIVEEKP